jgi:hypothetical protein
MGPGLEIIQIEFVIGHAQDWLDRAIRLHDTFPRVHGRAIGLLAASGLVVVGEQERNDCGACRLGSASHCDSAHPTTY